MLKQVDLTNSSLAPEVERVHLSDDENAERVLDNQLMKRATTEAARLAGAIPREGRRAVRSYLVLNPASYRRRMLIETPELASLPDETAPVLAAEESEGVKRVLVEVPPLGFAWVAAGEDASTKHWSGSALASKPHRCATSIARWRSIRFRAEYNRCMIIAIGAIDCRNKSFSAGRRSCGDAGESAANEVLPTIAAWSPSKSTSPRVVNYGVKSPAAANCSMLPEIGWLDSYNECR